MDTSRVGESAHIGKSLIIKGEVSGSEDLYLDGVVEGSIELEGNNLVIGPNGQVRANVNAKGVVVQGRVEGNIHATERAELRKSAVAVGDIFTQRVAVEDGAYFKGKMDIQREAAVKPSSSAASKVDQKPEVKSTASPPAASAKAASNAVAPTVPASTTVTKR